MRLTGDDRLVQRLARREQMRLPDELLQTMRPHAIGERPQIARALVSEQRLLRRIATGHGSGACELALRRADDVDAGRRRELQRRRVDVRIALAVREIQLHRLAEPVLDDHAHQLVAVESEFGMREIRLRAARLAPPPNPDRRGTGRH